MKDVMQKQLEAGKSYYLSVDNPDDFTGFLVSQVVLVLGTKTKLLCQKKMT